VALAWWRDVSDDHRLVLEASGTERRVALRLDDTRVFELE